MFKGSEVMGPGYRAHFSEKLQYGMEIFPMSLIQPLLKYKIIPFQWKSPFHAFKNELLSCILRKASFQLLFPEISEWL